MIITPVAATAFSRTTLERDRRFESPSLQRRVRGPSVPQQRSEDRRETADLEILRAGAGGSCVSKIYIIDPARHRSTRRWRGMDSKRRRRLPQYQTFESISLH